MTNQASALRHRRGVIFIKAGQAEVPAVPGLRADARLTRRKNIPHHRNRCSTPEVWHSLARNGELSVKRFEYPA